MLDWLKRKATPVPGEPPVESEAQKPATDVRLERLLGRLGSDSSAHAETVAKVLTEIARPPSIDVRAAAQPAAEALTETGPPPTTGSTMAGEPVAEALHEVDPPPSTAGSADDRFMLRRGELATPGHGPSAAELLAKGYSFATGPDGKMVIFDADGRLVDTALNAIDPLPDTDGMAAGVLAAQALNEIDPPAAPDDGTAGEPAAEALQEITPLPRTRRRALRDPAAEALDQIDPPRSGGKAAATPAGEFPEMRVIAVASQKGGSGKTTLAAHLAVRADAAGHGPVVLIDTDPQGSLAEWWHARRKDTPALATVRPEDLAANLAELRSYGTAIAIIDTPPALTGSIEQVIAMADLIVIPARPSPHDLRAAGGTVEMARKAGKPFLFVVNGASPRASITAQAVAALSEHGRVAPAILYHRTEFAASMIDGRTVLEAAASGRSAQEIAALWQYIYTQIRMRAAA